MLHILSEKYEEKDVGDKSNASNNQKSKEKGKEKTKDIQRSGARGRGRRSGSGRHVPSSTSNPPASQDDNATEPSNENGQSKNTEENGNQPTPMDVLETDDLSNSEEPAFDFHAHQGLATLGVAVIAMGEEIGLDMAFRMFGHLVRLV